MNRSRATLPCLLLIAIPLSCDAPRWDTPVEAYLSFLRATQKGDTATAYGALSTPTRTLLEQRARELSTASGGSLRNDPAALFFSGPKGQEPSEVKLVEDGAQRARIRVTSGDRGQEVTMVKEDGGWKVDLLDALHK